MGMSPRSQHQNFSLPNKCPKKPPLSKSLFRHIRLVWFIATALVSFVLLQQTNVSNNPADSVLTEVAATSLLTSLSSLIASHSSSTSSERATALPALVPNSTDTADAARFRQGVNGFGDPVHLGGRLDYDSSVLSTRVFELVRRDWGVRSLLDLGCGRGWSTLWFLLQGVNVQCVEASPTALKHSLLPNSSLVNHDFTRGPWWPEETIDLVWSASFVQQVSRQYMRNYFAAMSKTAILVVTFSRQPGWHHVELHDFEWWRLQFELQGFRFHEGLTKQVTTAVEDEYKSDARAAWGTEGYHSIPTELLLDTKVFINPSVASLPAHAHLFPEPGCFKKMEENGTIIHRDCNIDAGVDIETPLPSSYSPPIIDATKSRMWEILVRKYAKGGETTTLREDLDLLSTTTLPDDFELLRTAMLRGDFQLWRRESISQHAVMHIPDLLARGNRSLPTIPVVVWPLWEFGDDTAEAQHIEKDGIEQSRYLQLSDDFYNFDPNVVWIGDTGYAYDPEHWCGKFNELAVIAYLRRFELGLPTSWPIYIVDWGDYPDHRRCRAVEKTVGKEFVFYTKRSFTQGRGWNDMKGWVDEGELMPDMKRGAIYRHTPMIVRTDINENLQRVLRERGLNLSYKIETLDRPVDVTHFWPLNPTDPSSGVSDVESKLRTKVSKIVLDLGNTTGLNVYVGTAGSAARDGRRGVSSDYVDALLKTKIVLVTQRDEWEDHYRLFEALISGALVMMDRMVSLPEGLKNGTSVVEFSSEEELRALIDYYMKNEEERFAIASEGRRVSMMRHRSWHRMEEIIFGKALTVCSENPTGDCPYLVHANESSR